MSAKLLKMYPENPSPKRINEAAGVLRNDGIIIYPTDTVYGIGCNLFSKKAVEKLSRRADTKPHQMVFTLLCSQIQDIIPYTKPFSSQLFKILNKTLPGPYTYIVEASSKLPKVLGANRSSVGFRVPDNPILINLIKELGNPILNTSLKDRDEIIEYTSDPEIIYEEHKGFADLVIDGGIGGNVPSTVVDCTGYEFEIIREGAGDTKIFYA